MVNLRIPRTATFAWSTGNHLPLLATGTVAGAVDADFSNATHLELWDLSLQGEDSEGAELTPKATVNTESRFYDIAWQQTSDQSRGIIAGGLENGSLDLWNADALFSGEGDALISQTTKHSGPIKALQFNPFKSELLLTAGVKGEIFVWDLNNTSSPVLLGNRAQRADDFSSVDWNKKIPHILLSGGKNGLVTVWDVKQKKESLTLSHLGRKEVSAVAWHPENPTKLLTAIPDDSNPVVMVWDLRNANAPERTLSGHDQGVLSLAWCKQDVDLLLSSGKDNRTICWNPNTGDTLGEFPIGTNWIFQTRFNPRNPDIMAMASFDGKISVQSLQNKSLQKQADTSTNNFDGDGEDFFNKASFDPQGPSFSLAQPPKWYQCPVGASFGFGGKLITFSTPEAVAGQPRKSILKITKYAAESEVSSSTEAFETALKGGNFTALCDERIQDAKLDENREEWKLLKTLFDPQMKSKIIELLGFEANDQEDVTESLDKLNLDTKDRTSETAEANGVDKSKRLSGFFADGSADSDTFLSDLASTKGARTNNPFTIFSGSESEADKRITRALILGQFTKAVDICISEDRLSDAFMLAVCGGEKCVEKVQKAYFTKKNKGPNYLRILASVVGKNLWDVVHNADLANWRESMVTICTFAQENEFQDLCEALGERLEEELKTGNTGSRKDAALCYLVGAKLERVVGIWIDEQQEHEQSDLQSASTQTSSFAIHVKSLQQLMEKVTVFREATKFVDPDLNASGGWKLEPLYEKYCEYANVLASDGHLDIAAKYLSLVPVQYSPAEVARNRVKEATGKKATTTTTTTTRTSTLASATQTAGRIGARSPLQRAQPAQAQPISTFMPTPAPNQYAPPTSSNMYNQPQTFTPVQPPQPPQPTTFQRQAPVNPYAPSASTASNLYTPATAAQGLQPGFQPSQTPYGSSSFGYPGQTGHIAPPPPSMMSQPPLPAGPLPAAQRKDIPSWNDTPLVEPRRKTPLPPTAGTPPVTTPYPNPATSMSPTTPGFMPPRMNTPSSAPPPPKGSLPRGTSPANASNAYQQPAVSNPYAPPPNAANSYAPANTASNPYAPPQAPSNPYAPKAPSQSPYAPSTTSNTTAFHPNAPSGFAPPPPSTTPGAGSRYAPQAPAKPVNQMGGAPPMESAFAPPSQGLYGARPVQQSSGPPPMGGNYAPNQGMQQFGASSAQIGAPPQRPGSQPPPPGISPTPPPAKAPTPAPKHPSGDRSHLPEAARPVFELLTAELDRVSARAPPSFERTVQDTRKRLNILFDHLNNEDLLTKPTVDDMAELAKALSVHDHNMASEIQVEIQKTRTEECVQWMTGVKRLIDMSRATPA